MRLRCFTRASLRVSFSLISKNVTLNEIFRCKECILHNQDGKRCLGSVSTAFICRKWNSVRFIFHPASIQTCVFISCHPQDTGCPSTACSLLFRISKDLMCHLLARANVPRPPACRHHDVASSCWWYQPHHHKSFNLCNFLLTVYTSSYSVIHTLYSMNPEHLHAELMVTKLSAMW